MECAASLGNFNLFIFANATQLYLNVSLTAQSLKIKLGHKSTPWTCKPYMTKQIKKAISLYAIVKICGIRNTILKQTRDYLLKLFCIFQKLLTNQPSGNGLKCLCVLMFPRRTTTWTLMCSLAVTCNTFHTGVCVCVIQPESTSILYHIFSFST